MDTVITFIIELSRLIGKRIARLVNLIDINEETEMVIGLAFTAILIIILVLLLK